MPLVNAATRRYFKGEDLEEMLDRTFGRNRQARRGYLVMRRRNIALATRASRVEYDFWRNTLLTAQKVSLESLQFGASRLRALARELGVESADDNQKLNRLYKREYERNKGQQKLAVLRQIHNRMPFISIDIDIEDIRATLQRGGLDPTDIGTSEQELLAFDRAGTLSHGVNRIRRLTKRHENFDPAFLIKELIRKGISAEEVQRAQEQLLRWHTIPEIKNIHAWFVSVPKFLDNEEDDRWRHCRFWLKLTQDSDAVNVSIAEGFAMVETCLREKEIRFEEIGTTRRKFMRMKKEVGELWRKEAE